MSVASDDILAVFFAVVIEVETLFFESLDGPAAEPFPFRVWSAILRFVVVGLGLGLH